MSEIPSHEGRPRPVTDGLVDRSGLRPAWALVSTAALWGVFVAVDRAARGPGTTTGYAAAVLEGLALSLTIAMVGWAAASVGRRARDIARSRHEERERSREAIRELATRAAAAFERFVEVLERQPIAGPQGSPPPLDRRRLLAEIDQALRSGHQPEAESLVDELTTRFPDDPASRELRERLEAARRQAVEGGLAQIHAARQVNDPSRVLQLYKELESTIEVDRRGELERELSRWFLELIHRRLRGGRIQPEVVELATMVSETFAATVEGASLRASLPTLRRSVGLCPRCARPYPGTAAACPECLTGSSARAEPARDEPGPGLDDPTVEPPHPAGDGRDAGWLFYNEDDRDDPSPPA